MGSPRTGIGRPCIAGGAVLSVVCVFPLVGGYFDFIHEAFDRVVAGPDLLENPELLNSDVTYFFVENVFRNFVAVTVGEVYGTLSGATGWSRGTRGMGDGSSSHRSGQESRGKAYDLLVATCRRKPTWDTHNTISYEGELYEVLKEVEGHPPYRYLYELRKNPKWRVTRKRHEYDPRETLEKSS